jgi:hypothetical protein
MIPRRFALGRCLDDAAGLGEQQQAFCTKEAAAVDELKAARAKLDQELQAVARPREDGGR